MRALPALIRATPHPDAPPALQQYGQLVGTWKCKGSSRKTGAWQETPGESTWTWFYTLDGHAIEDVFEPSPESGGDVGINLRIYNPETEKWRMVWTTATQSFFDEFEAEYKDGEIVMQGERRARKAFPAHTGRITFHDITPDSFAWRYEAGSPAKDQWVEVSRIQCRRIGGLGRDQQKPPAIARRPAFSRMN